MPEKACNSGRTGSTFRIQTDAQTSLSAGRAVWRYLTTKGEIDEKAAGVPASARFSRLGRFWRSRLFRQGDKAGRPTALPGMVCGQGIQHLALGHICFYW